MKKFISLVLTLGLLLIYGQYALAEDFSFWKFASLQGATQIHDPNDSEAYLDPGAGGYSFGCEYISELDDHFEMGLGSEIDLVALSNNVHLAYMPVFGSVDYFPFTTDKPLYFKARIGYNISFFGDLYDYYNDRDPNAYYSIDKGSGGLYYGVGMGLKVSGYPSLRLEALYTVSNGSSRVHRTAGSYYENYSETNYNTDISCSMLNLALLVSF